MLVIPSTTALVEYDVFTQWTPATRHQTWFLCTMSCRQHQRCRVFYYLSPPFLSTVAVQLLYCALNCVSPPLICSWHLLCTEANLSKRHFVAAGHTEHINRSLGLST